MRRLVKNMKELFIKIGGMSCPHCSKAVETALRQLPGVKSVWIDLAKQRATVIADENKFDLKAAEQAIISQGYDYLGVDA
jgi:copper chaperone CopZ